MRADEITRIGSALGRTVTEVTTLAGGFSHETCLLTLTDGQVVARLGGADPAVEAAVMDAARAVVPVPDVLLVLPSTADGGRSVMVLEYVEGRPLSHVLADATLDRTRAYELGAEVGRVMARVGTITFDRPGFFADYRLTVPPVPPWSRQLPEFVTARMRDTPKTRLDHAARTTWRDLCAGAASTLTRVDDHARLVHSDANPKNLLVSPFRDGWRVDAVLDWEFAYSGCPYADAANMARFDHEHPDGFLPGFLDAFAAHAPADLPPPPNWLDIGRVLDMFALSELVTRPDGNPVADQAAARIRRWITDEAPRTG